MIQFLNQKFKFILVFSLVILGISFVFFGDWSSTGTQANPVIMKVKDRSVTLEEYRSASSDSEVLFFLQTGQFPNNIPQAQVYLQNSTWQRLLITELARTNGFETTTSAYVDFLKAHPAFQNESGFDQMALDRFFVTHLNPQGIREERFEQAVRDMILQEQMTRLVFSTAVVMPEQVDLTLNRQFGEVSVKVVNIDEKKIKAPASPDEETLNSYYNADASRFMNPPSRKFEVVRFMLTPEQEKLEEEEKKKALAELGEKAYAFTEPFYEAEQNNQSQPNWDELMKESGLQSELTEFLTEQSDAYLPSVMRQLFRLTEEKPVTSDYINTENGYLVFRLAESIPASKKPLAEVRNEVVSQWKEQQISRQVQEETVRVYTALQSATLAGEDFDKAAKQTGYRAETLPSFIPAGTSKPAQGPNAEMIRNLASQLKVGEVAPPQRTASGISIYYLASRAEPTADVIAASRDQVRGQLQSQVQRQLVESWMSDLIDQPDVEIPDSMLGPGI
ncbi:MAG: peptidyl-prolyl cis-trans isomerase [Verrucomicrobiota bacterium]